MPRLLGIRLLLFKFWRSLVPQLTFEMVRKLSQHLIVLVGCPCTVTVHSMLRQHLVHDMHLILHRLEPVDQFGIVYVEVERVDVPLTLSILKLILVLFQGIRYPLVKEPVRAFFSF